LNFREKKVNGKTLFRRKKMDFSDDFFESIENRNGEFNDIIYDSAYSLGLLVQRLKNAGVSSYPKKLFNFIHAKISGRKIAKFSGQQKIGEIQQIKTFSAYEKLQSKKIVVYTCIFGGYDDLKSPLLRFENVDYVCITDDDGFEKFRGKTKWTVKNVAEFGVKKIGGTQMNRYVKMHPKEFFAEYDYSIYVDGSVFVASFLGAWIEKIKPQTGFAVFSHGVRNCVYAESEVCILMKKGNKSALKNQCEKYKKIGLPEKFGLYECTVIAADLHNDSCAEIFDGWWKEFSESESLRDQISLPFVVWKKGFSFGDVGILGENIRRDKKITLYGHVQK
jgi:hypothetical protein